MTLGVRSEHFVQLTGGEVPANVTPVRGRVVLVEDLGESSLVYVQVPGVDGLLVSRSEGTSAARGGHPIDVGVAASSAHLFDSGGEALPRRPSSPSA